MCTDHVAAAPSMQMCWKIDMLAYPNVGMLESGTSVACTDHVAAAPSMQMCWKIEMLEYQHVGMLEYGTSVACSAMHCM